MYVSGQDASIVSVLKCLPENVDTARSLTERETCIYRRARLLLLFDCWDSHTQYNFCCLYTHMCVVCLFVFCSLSDSHPFRNHLGFKSATPVNQKQGSILMGQPTSKIQNELNAMRYPTVQRVAHNLPADPICKRGEVCASVKYWHLHYSHIHIFMFIFSLASLSLSMRVRFFDKHHT